VHLDLAVGGEPESLVAPTGAYAAALEAVAGS
jgi:hypothetical protein